MQLIGSGKGPKNAVLPAEWDWEAACALFRSQSTAIEDPSEVLTKPFSPDVEELRRFLVDRQSFSACL